MRRVEVKLMRQRSLRALVALLSLGLSAGLGVAQPAPAPAPVTTPAPVPAPEPEAPAMPVPKRPEDPRAAKAYLVFDQHCTRCHQTGRTQAPRASGGLANILDIAGLARDPLLVRPGLPDASPLYDILVTRHAPLEIYAPGPDTLEPRPEDIEAVRNWISELPPSVQTCPDRKPITSSDRDAWMREAQRLERDQAQDLRFISLIHLYNACVPEQDLAHFGQALNKLVNSLSSAQDPIKLTKLDPNGALFAFRLSTLGWTASQWQLIARDYPELPKTLLPDDILAKAGVRLPMVNGDWLAAAASEPPLYYALLDVPARLEDLAKINDVDLEKDVRISAARRVAIRASDITRGNRLVERHSGTNGPLWLAYDFATSTGAQDLFERPLGPAATPTIKTPFQPDEIRVTFMLPNGFFAYAVFDGAGNRVDRVLPGIEKPFTGLESNALEPLTRPGSNCMACHESGIRVKKDDFRPYATSAAATLSPEIRDLALGIYSPDLETALLVSGDNERNRKAHEAASLDPGLKIKGEEMVSALAHHYLGASDLKAAVALADVSREEFMKTLRAAEGPAAALARRLLQGVLPRADLDRLFALLAGKDKPQMPKGSGGFLRDVKSEIGLSVWIDKLLPAAGDLVIVQSEADTDCYLTLISIDATGKATVLFPNDFERDNLIYANRTLRIPGPDAPYQLRFKADGTETLIGRCSTSPVPPTGIEHDFVRQRFTVLGNWENFIEDTLVTEAEMRRIPEKAQRARTAREAAARRAPVSEPDPDARPNTAPGQALRDGRAVVIIKDE